MSSIERWNYEKHLLIKKTPIYTITPVLQPLILNCHSLGSPSGKTVVSSWRVILHNPSSLPLVWVECLPKGAVLKAWSSLIWCCQEAMEPSRSGTRGSHLSFLKPSRPCSWRLPALSSVLCFLVTLSWKTVLEHLPHPMTSYLSVVPEQWLQPPWTCTHIVFPPPLIPWASVTAIESWPNMRPTSHRYYTEKFHSWHLNFSGTHSNQNTIEFKIHPETKRHQLLIHITT